MTEVALVGLGPSGLAVLERLVTALRSHPLRKDVITVHVVEPSVPGPGVFGGDQPDYLILNSPCGEQSMHPFPDKARGRLGTGLFEWATASGYRWVEDRCEPSTHGRMLEPYDFLPRRLMGEYLAWFYRCLVDEAPPRARIVHHSTSAVDLAEAHGRERVKLANGAMLEVDHVVVTTGHTPNEAPAASFLLSAYPLQSLQRVIEPGSSVAVSGMGLVAIDVVTALTRGRGGSFVRRNGRLHYLPSGDEPRIALFSRTGFPYCSKPTRAPKAASAYQPVLFTQEAVSGLRHSCEAGRRRIDARAELLPLLLAEMTVCFYHHAALLEGGADAASAVDRRLAAAFRAGCFDEEVAAVSIRYGSFRAADHLMLGEGDSYVSSKDYEARVGSWLAADIAHARMAGTSPLKQAQEALKTLRATLQSAVELGGLTPASHRDFQDRLRSRIARLVAGPPVQRSEELLALLDAEIVRMPFGPSPALLSSRHGAVIVSRTLERPHAERVDHLIIGHLEQPSVHRSASAFLRRLYDKGRIRQLHIDGEELGSIDLDEDFHPLNAKGESQARLWFFGVLTEGARYDTASLPSVTNRRAFVEASRCVAEILGEDR